MERVRPSYPDYDADDVVLPPGYLEQEITRNLREELGEELWEALEVWEERQRGRDD
jgi:hypothetical protein